MCRIFLIISFLTSSKNIFQKNLIFNILDIVHYYYYSLQITIDRLNLIIRLIMCRIILIISFLTSSQNILQKNLIFIILEIVHYYYSLLLQATIDRHLYFDALVKVMTAESMACIIMLLTIKIKFGHCNFTHLNHWHNLSNFCDTCIRLLKIISSRIFYPKLSVFRSNLSRIPQ